MERQDGADDSENGTSAALGSPEQARQSGITEKDFGVHGV